MRIVGFGSIAWALALASRLLGAKLRCSRQGLREGLYIRYCFLWGPMGYIASLVDAIVSWVLIDASNLNFMDL
jgi:hypothetical protein